MVSVHNETTMTAYMLVFGSYVLAVFNVLA